ncbi:MAG: MFS transporter [Solirubrobacteraceae bacterium]
MARYRWVVLGAGVAAQAAFSALGTGLAVLVPQLRSEYDLSLAQIGVLLAATSGGMVLTLLAWGLLTDRVGDRIVVALGLGAAGLAFLAAATLPPYGVMFALLTVAGMSGASVSAASGRAVMGWFAADQRGLALGIRQTAVPLGWAVAALALPPIVVAGGLEAGLAALGAGCLAGAAIGVLLLRDPPREVLEVGDPSRPLRDRRLWRLCAGSTLYVIAQIVLTSFLVVYLHDERGFSVPAAAAVLAAVSVVGGALRIGLGFLSDRLATRIVPLVAVGVVLTGVIAVAALVAEASSWVLVPVLAAAGALSSSWNGLSFTAAAELAGRGKAGAALGFQQTALAIGGAIAPAPFAVLVGFTSWRTGFACLAALPLVGALALRPLAYGERPAHTRHTFDTPARRAA